MHRSGEKALQQTLNPTPLFPLLPLFFSKPRTLLNFHSQPNVIIQNKARKNKPRTVGSPNPETLSLSLTLYSLPNFLLSTYRHYSHLLPNNAGSVGGGGGGKSIREESRLESATKSGNKRRRRTNKRGRSPMCNAFNKAKHSSAERKTKQRQTVGVSERAVSQ
jgi:hypothetical protein